MSLIVKDGFQAALQKSDRVFNIDETAIWLSPKGQQYLGKKEEAPSAIQKHSDWDNATVCVNIRPDDTFAPALSLYKYKRLPAVYKMPPDPDW